MGAPLWFMHVASFYWFVDNVCGGEKKIKDLTTGEVCERFVKPYVKKHKATPPEGSSAARLVEMDCKFQSESAEGCAVFISHSWQAHFLQTIDAIYANLGPKALVWFDVFSYNQFSPEVSDFDWWTSLLYETIKSCERCALVCDLTELNLGSNPCKRLWCLFETFITVQMDMAFEVFLTPASQDEIKADLPAWSNELLSYSIDINESECSLPQDKQNILTQIKIDSRDAFNASVIFLVKEQFYLALAFLGAPVERWGPYLESLKLAEETTLADHGRYLADVVPLFSVSDPLDLIEASEAGNYSKVKEVLKASRGVVNGTDDKGQTALHVAATYKIASYLIYAKADVNLHDKSRGLTPLHTAKSFQVTKVLLENGADVNAQDSTSWRALHCAGALPDTEQHKGPGITEALLAAGADVNALTQQGITALQRACGLGRKDMVEALLQAGADVNAIQHPAGTSALHCATKAKITIALIAAKADVHARTLDDTGETAMHRAAARGDSESLVALLAGRAKVNATDHSRWQRSALHRAAKEGHDEQTIDTLIAVKANIALPEQTSGDTPLHLACCQSGGYTEAGVVEVLVRHKADPNALNRAGEAPLHKAARESHSEEVIDALCQARADVNARDDLAGEAPLHLAASQELYTELEVAEALLAARADVNARNYAGETPLDKAVSSHSAANDTSDLQALLRRAGGLNGHRTPNCRCTLS